MLAAVCWGLDTLRSSASSAAARSVPSRRLCGCHNLWFPGTTEALPAPTQRQIAGLELVSKQMAEPKRAVG